MAGRGELPDSPALSARQASADETGAVKPVAERPVERPAVRPPDEEPGPETSTAQTPVEKPDAERPAAGPAGEEPEPDLYALVERMQPSGVTRMVLDNSQLVSHTDDRWELVLAEGHDLLLRDDSASSVQEVVSSYMGRKVRVDIVGGKTDRETPAERRRQLDTERQRAAEDAIESDETVRSLLRVFGGRIGSVQPLDDREYRSP